MKKDLLIKNLSLILSAFIITSNTSISWVSANSSDYEYELDLTCSSTHYFDDEEDQIINIKHGGIEKWGIECVYLGTSVPVEKMVDACIEENAQAILASTIISHDNVHYKNMKRLHELCVEKGIRDKVIICAGGTQVIPEEAVKTGIDMGFGRNSHGIDVATFLAEERQRRRGERE